MSESWFSSGEGPQHCSYPIYWISLSPRQAERIAILHPFFFFENIIQAKNVQHGRCSFFLFYINPGGKKRKKMKNITNFTLAGVVSHPPLIFGCASSTEMGDTSGIQEYLHTDELS